MRRGYGWKRGRFWEEGLDRKGGFESRWSIGVLLVGTVVFGSKQF